MKFIPHNYQSFSVQFIKEHPEAMLFLDMGLGSQNRDIPDGNIGSYV